MNGTTEYQVKWSKSILERQIPHALSYTEALKSQYECKMVLLQGGRVEEEDREELDNWYKNIVSSSVL